jgi:ATP-binding cassette subfamily C (CFTR/MRP) protein 1
MYLLQRELGVACAIPISVAIGASRLYLTFYQDLTYSVVSFLGSLGATSLVMQRQALWLEAIERRIAATSAMLESMKGVKMGGLTDVLREDLQRLRIDELDISKKFRKLMIWTMMICQYAVSNSVHAVLIRCSIHLADRVSCSSVCGVLSTRCEE